MSEQVTADILTCDSGYRWNDNLTDGMTVDRLQEYLCAEALDYESIEWEVAYGIYREFVWRFPKLADAWQGLARSARQLELHHEADVADVLAAELTQ